MRADPVATEPRVPGEGSRPGKPEILRVTDLVKHFPVTVGAVFRREVARVHAVDGVSFVVHERQTLGLVGESGSGKSTVLRSVLQLTRPTRGRILFRGEDLLSAPAKRLRGLRRDMQVVFQDPYASLNPRLTVARIVAEPLEIHRVGNRGARVRDLLQHVGLGRDDARRYPHEFSGGQRQRIAVARALATDPKLILCDEPVSALDVSVRGQILNLLMDLQEELGLSYVVVSHDLSVVREIADMVAVMYLGKIVEMADTDELYGHPRHPYTAALLAAVPSPDPPPERARERVVVRGELPSPTSPPRACRFHTRCWKAEDVCRAVEPPLAEVAPGHWAACHFPEGGAPAGASPGASA